MKGIIFFAFLASCRGLSEEWNSFKDQYGKSYSSADEENARMRIFKENMLKIEEHNKKYDEGLTTYEMGMNSFGDMTAEEMRELLLCLNNSSFPNNIRTYSYIPPATLKKLPDTVDWREKGAVTPVKNQAQCGSCWAFSATGALEGQHFRKTGKLISLSEQQLVDCSGAYGNYGCNGGMPDRAYSYIINNKAIATEADYPYEGWDGACRFARASGVVVTGIMEVEQDETTLQKAVATVGPISICIHATNNFMFYKKGIFEDNTCSSSVINHAVLAVGYGTDSGHDYWLVKNSWGTDWGEDGYIKMARNRDNQCAVALIARYPLV